jgi:hypothetical protein
MIGLDLPGSTGLWCIRVLWSNLLARASQLLTESIKIEFENIIWLFRNGILRLVLPRFLELSRLPVTHTEICARLFHAGEGSRAQGWSFAEWPGEGKIDSGS